MTNQQRVEEFIEAYQNAMDSGERGSEERLKALVEVFSGMLPIGWLEAVCEDSASLKFSLDEDYLEVTYLPAAKRAFLSLEVL